MVDPITIVGLGAKVIDILFPLVKKGAQQYAKDVGIAACKKAEDMLESVKAKLSGDETAADMLSEFEKDPVGYKPVIEKIIQKKVEQDNDLAAELDKSITEIANMSLNQKIGVVEESAEAVNLDSDKIPKGNIRATQEADNVKGKLINVRFKHD